MIRMVSSLRRRRVAADIPAATPPTMTTVRLTLMTSALAEPKPEPALPHGLGTGAALLTRNASHHLGDVHPAPVPRRTATRLARDPLAHHALLWIPGGVFYTVSPV